MQSKPYQAVAWYVTKYVAKQSDQRQKAITERQKKCKNPLMAICLKKEFRVRSSRKLGMELPVNGSPQAIGTFGTEPNQLRFQPSVSDSERERQKAIDLEHRRAAFARHFGCAPGSEKHVESYCRFRVQWQSSIASMTVTLKSNF
ncbi:gpA [Histomonas meleagridis]|nr:gpA [Histomonas meleagridis]